MVSSRGCFLMFQFLLSLLCISSVSFPDSSKPPVGNHDCSCLGNNLGPIDASSTPKGRKQEALTSVILILIMLNIIIYKLRELHETSLGENKKPPSLSTEHPCHRFLLSEMQLATNSFDQSMIIGKGGFGKVYRGVIDDGGRMVAIKRLDSRSKQGAIEFWTEIKMLSRFRHSNLVSLVGYCDEFDEMMLVYEYISGGNLAERLYKVKGSSQKSPLSWVDRLKICIGAARALDYLHTGTGVRQRIIHRDVKSSNILLDGNFTAKVSDFGLSKISQTDQGCTHVSTDVKGSFGYFDPSYFLTRRLTRKSDVYSFGVVLLEVLCGRPAVDPSLGDDDLGLVGWAQQFIKEGTSNHIVDPSLMGLTPCSRVKAQIMPNCLKAFVEITDKCLQTRPKNRPTMGEVVVALEAALALQERGDALVVSSHYHNQNSYMKSGKIITLSRMLRNMFVVKSPVKPAMGDVEPLGKNKRQNKWCVPNKFSNKEDLLTESGDTFQVKVGDSGLKIFSLDALKMATKNFSDDRVVGEGAFGKVYKGWVERETYVPSKVGSGIPIAVKKLDTDGYQGFEEWETEVKLSGELSHPNVSRILGYCSQDMELLLVYEFMHKGSLENHILTQRFGETLSWSTRVKIMLGTAKGIAYLHSRENQIIFRDLKTSNILLDQDFNAKVADFGLARHGPINGETHLVTQVMGTYGYAAPEYVETGYLNGKNDIYAFGVVLLETLTGLRVFDKARPKNEQDLVQWARPMLPKKKKLMTIVDPSLGDDYPPEAVYQCGKLILKCTQAEPKERPCIEQVLQRLERISCVKT
ncbi:putative transferase, protein kinase RLK-Pelle-RLCK-VIIa-2 family [Helianthus debilis subsp. tardiflorus]